MNIGGLIAVIIILFFVYLGVRIIIEFNGLMDAWDKRERMKRIDALREELDPEDFIRIMKG